MGIDPGSTVGIAALSLCGGKVALANTNAGIEEAVRIIERMGTPSVVCTDVQPAPEAVVRVASYFNAKLFVPRENVREEFKKQVANGAGVSNAHERDAYCAAVLGYRSVANRMRQIDALEGFEKEELERMKHLVLNGHMLKNAILSLQKQEGAGALEEGEGKVAQERGRAAQSRQDILIENEKLREEVLSLSRAQAHLRKSLEAAVQEKQGLLFEIRKRAGVAHASLMRDTEVRNLKYRIRVLEEIVQKMRGRRGGKEDKGKAGWKGRKEGAGFAGKAGADNERAGFAGRAHERAGAGNAGAAAKVSNKEGESDKGIKGLQENADAIDMQRLLSEYRKGRQS